MPGTRYDFWYLGRKGHLVIVDVWTARAPQKVSTQNSMRNGSSLTCGLWNQQRFWEKAHDSGFDGNSVSIEENLLASMVKGDGRLMLNPGNKAPLDISAKNLKAHIDTGRWPT